MHKAPRQISTCISQGIAALQRERLKPLYFDGYWLYWYDIAEVRMTDKAGLRQQ